MFTAKYEYGLMKMTASLGNRVENGTQEVDILKIMSRAALEYIGRGGLGSSFGPLEDGRSSAHSVAIQSIG